MNINRRTDMCMYRRTRVKFNAPLCLKAGQTNTLMSTLRNVLSFLGQKHRTHLNPSSNIQNQGSVKYSQIMIIVYHYYKTCSWHKNTHNSMPYKMSQVKYAIKAFSFYKIYHCTTHAFNRNRQ